MEIKKVVRDGFGLIKLKCPKCGIWGDIDEDQYEGKVSIMCDCGFHETLNLKEEL